MKQKILFLVVLSILAIFVTAAVPVAAVVTANVNAPVCAASDPIYGPAAPVLQEGENPEPGLDWLVNSWDQISDLLGVSFAGIPIAVLVLIVTLWAKSTNLAGTDNARRWWATGSALAFSLLDTAKNLTTYDQLTAIIIAEAIVKGIMAALLASLVYKLPTFWGVFKDFVKARQAQVSAK